MLISLLLLGLASVEQKMSLYIARIWFGKESMGTIMSAGVAVAVIAVSVVVPILSKKYDKYKVLCIGLGFAILMDIVAFYVGFSNPVIALVMVMLKCTGLGFWQVIIYMLIADTVEYGAYKSGTKAAGISFSLQTFVAKLKNALMGSIILFSMSRIGFVEGENVVQPEGVAEGLWKLFCLFPAIGFSIALVVLLVFYKLKAKDVQVMAEYNNGAMTVEDAEAALLERYGKAYRK